MVLGWRRAFCTSIPREKHPPPAVLKEKQEDSSSSNPSPKLGFKFSIFSNPSTPRLQSQPVSSPTLRCRTTTATVPASSAPESPRLQCKTKTGHKPFQLSNPSSPRSPSAFSLFKSNLRFSKSRCGLCMQNVKSGQGMAIFTAECSHSFHLPCIAAHVKKQQKGNLACPLCNSTWKQMSALSIPGDHEKPGVEGKNRQMAATTIDFKKKNETKHQHPRSVLKVYNDDEPLMSTTSKARFNPIPESDENEEGEMDGAVDEFQGFLVDANISPVVEMTMNSRHFEVSLSPEAAVVSVGRGSETCTIVLKLRAPPALENIGRRPPIDLVTVLDVSGSMTMEKLQTMKRAMHLVVASLSSADRLSVVAFSSTSKRLLPLRRMTTTGRRSARCIVDALGLLQGTSSACDALKKAAKVLQDRREKNPAVSIILLKDEQSTTTANSAIKRRPSTLLSSTRSGNDEIPVHSFGFTGMNDHGKSEDAFAKCISGALSVVVQDLRLQLGLASGSAPVEIAGVYSCTDRPVCLGSGSIRLDHLYAEEERELLVELKVPFSADGTHHVLSVRFSYRDPSTQEHIHSREQRLLVPRPHSVRSSAPGIERLRNLFVATRAVAESRRLMERNDLRGAHHMLSSARTLLLQSKSTASADELVRRLEAELAELNNRRQSQNQTQQIQRRRTNSERDVDVKAFIDEKGEPLTPTSAWRAAERLAKVAIMRKSMNRVSDLHGFENARF